MSIPISCFLSFLVDYLQVTKENFEHRFLLGFALNENIDEIVFFSKISLENKFNEI